MYKATQTSSPDPAIEWYDQYAETVADSYEAISSPRLHKHLFKFLGARNSPSILDVGAGSGRDAAALAAAGYSVVAVEPSKKMLAIAKSLHASSRIRWIEDRLPELAELEDPQFDAVLLSAVWMHLPDEQRDEAMSRLADLISPGGAAYVTLRLGPLDRNRGFYPVDPQAFTTRALQAGFRVEDHGKTADVLQRRDVQWQSYAIHKPAAE